MLGPGGAGRIAGARELAEIEGNEHADRRRERALWIPVLDEGAEIVQRKALALPDLVERRPVFGRQAQARASSVDPYVAWFFQGALLSITLKRRRRAGSNA